MDKLMKIRLAVGAFAVLVLFGADILNNGVEGWLGNLPLYGLVVAAVLFVLGLQWLWRLIFCRAKTTPAGARFELSAFAEFILHALNLLWIGSTCYELYTRDVKWYEAILPVLMLLIPLGLSINYLLNRKDFLEIRGDQLVYFDEGKEASLPIDAYRFFKAESQALSASYSQTDTWHLEVFSEKRKSKVFDLKNMSLAGHKHALEKYLSARFPQRD
jgi:hypothetical protein